MAARTTILPAHNALICVCAGHCTGRELLAVERRAWGDPRCAMGAFILIDLLLVRELDIELSDWKALIALNRKLQTDGHAPERTAVIARGAHDFTLVGAFRLVAEAVVSLHLHVADTLGDALAWHGIPEAAPDLERAVHALRSEIC